MEPIESGYFYHIYNRGINSCDLFSDENDFIRFLNLYEKYIDPVAETYAWCLMPNHFHFLVRIKEESEIGIYKPLNSDGSKDSVRFQTTALHNLSESDDPDRVKGIIPKPIKHFSHLFNAYAKYYNIRCSRHGSLFERPFKRKRVDHDAYLKRLVLYIHNNPIHHGYCNHPIEYPWSSYLTCISDKQTKLRRESTLGWFNNVNDFKIVHKQKLEILEIEKYLDL